MYPEYLATFRTLISSNRNYVASLLLHLCLSMAQENSAKHQ